MFKGNYIRCPTKTANTIRERSHMTSAAEGGRGFEMLTVADKGGGGGV